MATNSTITPELLDQLLANYERPEDLTGEDGLFKRLKKALIERALGAELTEHLGYEKGDPAGRGSGNSRNGTSAKTLLTDDGEIDIAVPRDRAGSFAPQLIAKGQTHFTGFDDRILSLYARGLTVREIQGHLAELYGTEVSPDLISRVTDAVLDEVREWQNRPLDPVYPVVFFDALRAKSATRVWSRTRPSMWHWRSIRTARSTFWGCGSSTPKAPNSGSRSSTNSRPAASTISSSRWSTGSKALPRRSIRCFRRPSCRLASCT